MMIFVVAFGFELSLGFWGLSRVQFFCFGCRVEGKALRPLT